MGLESGTRLGSYQIGDPLGKGGMGEVYRARDTKLGREVAIKVLPAEFSQDPERSARLEREARMLASLNHPNIAAIYGLEQSEDTRFLVLELVEGDTLAERLGRGAIPIEESLELALHIAEALEAAHERGVIHRDLKPANIKITPEGRVKVLDFGLAKAFSGDQADVNLSNSPTLSIQATQQGVILGTAAYMSPEQARGETADKRADIWAFGCVLFEMLTGRGTFDGKTVSDVLAGVLRADPEWTSLPANLHPRIRLLLERCLEKEAASRYHDIADGRVDLQHVLTDPAGVLRVQPQPESAVPQPQSRLPWVAAGFVLAAIAGLVIWVMAGNTPDETPQLARFTLDMPADGPIITTTGWRVVTLSPDGSTVAYAGLADVAPVGRMIYVRRIDELEAVPLRGSEGGTAPFFSPDGQTVGFVAEAGGDTLKRVSVQGGPETTIGSFTGQPYGMHWGEDDNILFAVDSQPGILRVPSVGGDIEQLTSVDTEAGELQHGQATLLPDGDTILFTIRYMDAREPQLALLAGGETRSLGISGSHPTYASTGHIVYAVSDGTIRSVPFDMGRLEVTDTNPTPVVEGLHTGTVANYVTGNFTLAANGTMVYMTGVAVAAEGRDRRAGLAWVNRNGAEEPIGLQPDDYTLARVSPDGTMVVLVVGDGTPGSASLPPELWILDLVTGIPRQLTFDPGTDDAPVWTRDSSRILFRSNRTGTFGVYSIPAQGGEAEPVFSSTDAPFIYPWSLSPDGGTLASINALSLEDTDVATVALDTTALTHLLTDQVIAESEPVIAPNGAWIAFQEGETPDSNRQQITFRPFPGFARARFPVGPGMHPIFSGNGSELFFFDGEGISALSLEYEPSIRWGTPERLFQKTYWWGAGGPDGSFGRAWDWDPTSGRFLMITMPEVTSSEAEDPNVSELILVLNWTDELEALVPAP